MNREQLLQRLDGVEWQDFEVKAAAGGLPQDALRTVCAFANSGGGWLVLGVSERAGGFEITGVADLDRLQNELLGTCRSPEKFHRPPVVRPRALRVEVVFMWNTASGGVSAGVNGGVNGGEHKANPNPDEASLDTRLLALIAAQPGQRAPALAHALDEPQRTIERALRRLRERGLVVFEGAPKTGVYQAVLKTTSHVR